MIRILFVLLFIPFFVRGQIITTIGGNGIAGYTGNGGAATAAAFNYPHGIALDSNNNIYVADMWNNVIRKIDLAGIVTTVAGNGVNGYTGDGGPAIHAALDLPGGVAMANNGDYYVLDRFNHLIRKVSAAGIITTFAGNGIAGYSGDGGPATAASFSNPYDIAVDGPGNVYVADYDNSAIRKIAAATGTITTVAGNGVAGFWGDGGAATAANMNKPLGVAVDQNGNIYISDSYNNRIRKVNAAGIISTIAGTGAYGFSGDGAVAYAAEINTPASIKVDNTGNIYFYDVQNNRVRKISSTGIITTVAGNGTAGYSGDGGPATDASVNLFGLAVDRCHNLYISDRTNNRIRKVSGIIGARHICVGTNSVFIDEGPGGTWYTSAPDVAAITIASGCLVTGISPGVANIYYVIGTDTAVSHVTVDAPDAGSIAGHGMVCVGSSDTLIDSAAGGTWGRSNTNATIVHGIVTGRAAGIDTIIYTVHNTCGTVSTQFTVTINPLPDVGVITGKNVLCVGDTIMLSDNISGGTWSVSDTITARMDGPGVVRGISPGNTIVYYTVANPNCRDSAYLTLSILTAIACEAGVGTIAKQEQVMLYPNPVTNELTIADGDKITAISITNRIGQVVYSGEYAAETVQVGVANLPTGIYFVKINNAKVLSFVKE